MAIKVAINGFGRIGRQTFRRMLQEHPDLDVVAINDLTDTKTLAHLLKYDSNYGVFDKEISFTENSLVVDGKEYSVLAQEDPAKLPWKKLGIDIVLECTGLFTSKEGATQHIKAGAKKVIVSAPCKDCAGYVLGVNTENFDIDKDDVIDMGSCTTNCPVPV